MNVLMILLTIMKIEKVFDRNCFVDISVSIVKTFPMVPATNMNNPKYLNDQKIFVLTLRFLFHVLQAHQTDIYNPNLLIWFAMKFILLDNDDMQMVFFLFVNSVLSRLSGIKSGSAKRDLDFSDSRGTIKWSIIISILRKVFETYFYFAILS